MARTVQIFALLLTACFLAAADVPPQGLESSPGPWSDSADLTLWPNRTSNANSDPWLAENHDLLKRLKPRVLLVNFSNDHPRAKLEALAKQIIAGLAEGSRWHGYADPQAPVFLQYEVFKLVDLRDAGSQMKGDSSRIPIKRGKDGKPRAGINLDYNAFFSEAFARHYGVPDPKRPDRFLRLDELVDRGYVHELWFFVSGAAGDCRALEGVELKPAYDEQFKKIPNRHVQAGNGGDPDQKWTGRSIRLGCINASRGSGCFLESLSHCMEGTSNSNAIPYFTRYFREFSGHDLRERHQLPFDSLYGVDYAGKQIQFPNDHTMVVTHKGKEHRVENYVAQGGNAHFPPNARGHYDLNNDQPVLSTIEDWRMGSGDGGKDRAKPWTNASIRQYRDLAPDCMGPWLVYWRQNMPGLGNQQKDDRGKPMKNWWPFLFY